MSELTVVGFQGIHRATQILAQLRDLQAEGAITLEDAVAVYRTEDGELRVDQSVKVTEEEGATLGGLLGVLVAGLLTAPFTGGAGAAVAASAVSTAAVALGATGAVIGGEEAAHAKKLSGISEDFVKQVGGMVQPGESAVFILGNAGDATRVVERFRGQGGTVLRTTLPPDEAKRLEQVIAQPVPAPASVARSGRSA